MSTNDWLDNDGIGPIPDDLLNDPEEDDDEEDEIQQIYQLNFDEMTIYVFSEDKSVIVKDNKDDSQKRFDSLEGLKEEMPEAYKMISTIIQTVELVNNMSGNLSNDLNDSTKKLDSSIDIDENTSILMKPKKTNTIMRRMMWMGIAIVGVAILLPFIDLAIYTILNYWF